MRREAAATAAVALVIVLAGCVSTPPAPTKTAQPSTSPTSSPSPSPSASPSAEQPNAGPLAAERADFDAALATLLAANADPDGRSVVDALVSAGFDKAAMEVTPDKTAIGLDADSIQFSVRIGEQCIVGQSGNVGYHSAVFPVLDSGTCLVGKTRTITW